MRIKEPLKYVCLWQDNLTEILMSLFQPSLIQLRVGPLAPRSVSVVITGITHSSATDDYLPFTGFPVMFVSAPSQECIDIVIVDDNDIEQDEFFEVEIDSQQADGAVSIGSLNRTIVGIVDNGK